MTCDDGGIDEMGEEEEGLTYSVCDGLMKVERLVCLICVVECVELWAVGGERKEVRKMEDGRWEDGRWKMEEGIFVATAGPVDDVQL